MVGELIIAASNLNMPRRVAVFGGQKAHENFLKDAGYSAGSEIDGEARQYTGGGFEWSEVRNLRNIFMGRLGLKLARRGLVSSLHQSWRSTTAREVAARIFHPSGEWNGVRNTPKAVLRSLGLVAVIPFIDSWRNRLAPFQTAAGKKLPVVAYPNEQQPPNAPGRFKFDYPVLAKDFLALRHQPTAETLQAWGVLTDSPELTVEGMLAAQREHGFSEVAFDTKHAFAERHGLNMPDPVEMTRLLAERSELAEIHLNLTDDAESLRLAMQGNLADTHHGKMLAAAMGALAADSVLTVVTEVTEEDFNNIGVKNIADGNKTVVRAILQLGVD